MSSSPLRHFQSSDDAQPENYDATPPSSPPVRITQDALATNHGFSTSTSRINAFSVLGKRKQPLSHGDNNARPAKRAVQVSVTKRKQDESRSQTHLSLGQTIEKRCKDCGMVYVACSAEDRALHDIYHKQQNSGYAVGSQFIAKATPVKLPHREQSTASQDTIRVVRSDDPSWQKKHARHVLDIITQCLGACPIPDTELWQPPDKKSDHHYELYMYLRGTTCIAAALVEMPQRQARRVLPPILPRSASSGETAVERLRRRREEAAKLLDAPLRVSDDICTAPVGITRIWTAPDHRKQAIAQTLLDALYLHWITTTTQPSSGKLHDVAFSQPTAAGTRLARKWFNRNDGWLAY